MKQIIIIGSRRRNSLIDFIKVAECFLLTYEEGDTIVSGGCPKGGDKFAEIIAEMHNLTKANGKLKIFRADWKRLGRGAGFVRNTDIAKIGDEVIACVAADRTGGTEDTLKKFKKFHPEGTVILC